MPSAREWKPTPSYALDADDCDALATAATLLGQGVPRGHFDTGFMRGMEWAETKCGLYADGDRITKGVVLSREIAEFALAQVRRSMLRGPGEGNGNGHNMERALTLAAWEVRLSQALGQHRRGRSGPISLTPRDTLTGVANLLAEARRHLLIAEDALIGDSVTVAMREAATVIRTLVAAAEALFGATLGRRE